jgi:hypothetical protein
MRSVELLYYPGMNLLAGEAKALVVHPAPGEGLQPYLRLISCQSAYLSIFTDYTFFLNQTVHLMASLDEFYEN